MTRRDLNTRLWTLLAGLLAVTLAASVVRAHTDPPGVNATGSVSGGLVAFRDVAGTIPVVGPATECETIYFRACLTYLPVPVPGTIGPAFEGGRWELVMPNGTVVNITPALGVPCVGGTTIDPNSGSNNGRGLCQGGAVQIVSDLVPYTVNLADVSGGVIFAQQIYGDPDPLSPRTAFMHIGVSDVGGVSVSVPTQIFVLRCHDGNACTNDSCDPGTEQCVYTPITCDDGDACTTDTCSPATGCVHTPIVCNDGNVCTNDRCDSATGCVFTNDDTNLCSDNNACTTDACVAGTCVGTAIICDDHNTCTNDSCDPATGCVYTGRDCDDLNPCTHDECRPGTGCVNIPDNNLPCSDGNACTVDRCVMGECWTSPIVCDDGSACTTDSCSPATGACVYTPINCHDGNPCTDDSCDPSRGCVYTSNDQDGDGLCAEADNCPDFPNPDQADGDTDGVGDSCDNCIVEYNPLQEDFDADGYGDACDNCPLYYNADQADFDADFEGDRCDLDDGLIFQFWTGPNYLEWQEEFGFTSWNAYEGDLDVLKGMGVYTQLPGSNPLADRHCGETWPWVDDFDMPPAGKVIFSLVTGVSNGVEGSLNQDSEGNERPNGNPCP